MALTPQERVKLRASCSAVLYGFRTPSPAEEFRLISEWCQANDVAHDSYGEGRLIEDFERRIAELTGKAAAAFMPSGVMAQLIAIRIWTQRAGLPRFGLHPTSHLIVHEEENYQALFQLHGAAVGDRLRPMTASDLEGEHQPLACLLVELPIREAGGQLPDWDQLEALKSLAQQREIPLHMDGARLWECRPYLAWTVLRRDRRRVLVGLCLHVQGPWRHRRRHAGRRRGLHRRGAASGGDEWGDPGCTRAR